jgi:hypothetical protein
MTTMRPEDVAALFDLPPPPAPSDTSALDVEAAEAALAAEMAAELACALASGDAAADAPDSRAGRRIEVSWPGRLRLPGGEEIAVEVRNVSQAGVGLASAGLLPAGAIVALEMRVPPQERGGDAATVRGTVRTTYTVADGAGSRCGGSWMQVAPDDLALVDRWIERLRR